MSSDIFKINIHKQTIAIDHFSVLLFITECLGNTENSKEKGDLEYRLRKSAFIRSLPKPFFFSFFFSYFMYCEKVKQLNCVPLQKIFTGGVIHSRSATDNTLIFKKSQGIGSWDQSYTLRVL